FARTAEGARSGTPRRFPLSPFEASLRPQAQKSRPINRSPVSHETLVVLDFGSQVTQLIARRVRELGVYAEIHPYDLPLDELKAKNPIGIVLSGGPSSIYDEGAPVMNPEVLTLGIPVMGICYGLYSLVANLGGEVVPAKER